MGGCLAPPLLWAITTPSCGEPAADSFVLPLLTVSVLLPVLLIVKVIVVVAGIVVVGGGAVGVAATAAASVLLLVLLLPVVCNYALGKDGRLSLKVLSLPARGASGCFSFLFFSCCLPAQVANASLPVCPIEPGFDMHWLAVDGQQPLLPQNPIPSSAARGNLKHVFLGVYIKIPVGWGNPGSTHDLRQLLLLSTRQARARFAGEPSEGKAIEAP